ncbi:MAG: YHS domain-containing protein [Armatimonadota bacterium]
MRDRVRLAALIAGLALLAMSWAVLATANTHGSHQGASVVKAGATRGTAGAGATKTCELCQKPISAKSEATLEHRANGSVHHYACIECALVSARDYFTGDVTVRTKTAGGGTPIEWTRHQGKWQVSPASAVVMSLPEKSGDCQQDHLAFKDAAEFTFYAKTHARAAGHETCAASQVDAILQAGKQPAPQVTTCPVMRHAVRPNAQTDWTVYKGKTYYFCCAGCKPKFTSNPTGYLSGKIQPPAHPEGMKGGACGSHGDKGCGGNDSGCAGESGAGVTKPAPAHGKAHSA